SLQNCATDSRHPDVLSAGDDRRLGVGASRRRHQSDGLLQLRVYVGLKPYRDKAWDGDIRTKEELTDSINKRLTAFPGIIFNYTQPAEDAVDEALTGLKSS